MNQRILASEWGLGHKFSLLNDESSHGHLVNDDKKNDDTTQLNHSWSGT